jgi:hypothetical protein
MDNQELLKRVEALEKWKADREQQQITFPLEIQSVNTLVNADFIQGVVGVDPTVYSGTFTVTIASPAVFTATGHGLKEGWSVYFTTTGALPTGITELQTYYVISAGLTADTFQVSDTPGGSAINTSGTQSGTHTFQTLSNMGEPIRWLKLDKEIPGGVNLWVPLYAVAEFGP